MKYIVFILALMLVLLVSDIKSQTFIEPEIGIGISKISGYSQEEFPINDIFSDKGFDHTIVLVGLGLIQHFTDHVSLKLSVNYKRQVVDYDDNGFVGYTDIRFEKYAFSAIPSYSVFENVTIGLGFSFNQLRNFEIGKKDRDIWDSLGKGFNQTQIGWIVAINYYIRPISMELRYSGMNGGKMENDKWIRQINSFEFQISCPIKIANKCSLKNNKTVCPKF